MIKNWITSIALSGGIMLTGFLSAQESTLNLSVLERPINTNLVSHDRQILRNGDVITYMIKEDPFSQKQGALKLEVNSLGVQFPITHDPKNLSLKIPLNVVNKSVAQVKNELRTRLLKDYYHKVTVEIFVQSKAEQIGKVQIFDTKGTQVNTSLKIDLADPPTLTEALSQVTFKDSQWLDRESVILIRTDANTRIQQRIQIKWNDALTGKIEDPVLRDGDKIQVRERGFRF